MAPANSNALTPALDMFGHDVAANIEKTFNLWKQDYPESIKHQRRTTPGWWDRAAACCQSTGTPAALLVYLGFAFTNYRPEDAQIDFGATLFRSDSLLRRGIINFRGELGAVMKRLEPLHLLKGHDRVYMPATTLASARLVANYTCEYFATLAKVREAEALRERGKLSDPLWDLMVYRLCNQHPFLLMHTARTPWMRAVAGVNAFFLTSRQPWHFEIWEGVTAAGASLNDLHGLCRGNPDEFYAGGKLGYSWPVSPDMSSPLSVYEDYKSSHQRPRLQLMHSTTCNKTDLYLANLLDDARRRQ